MKCILFLINSIILSTFFGLKIISVCESKKAQNAHSDDDDLEDALHEMTAFTGKCVTSSKSLTKGVINVKRLDNIIRGHRFGKVI